jgi:hypothetical protein
LPPQQTHHITVCIKHKYFIHAILHEAMKDNMANIVAMPRSSSGKFLVSFPWHPEPHRPSRHTPTGRSRSTGIKVDEDENGRGG